MAREPAGRRRTVPNYARTTRRVFIGCRAPRCKNLTASIVHMGLGRHNEKLRMKRTRRRIRTLGRDVSGATELDHRAGVLTLDFGFARVYLRYGRFSYTFLVVRRARCWGPARAAENLPEERARCHDADVCRN